MDKTEDLEHILSKPRPVRWHSLQDDALMSAYIGLGVVVGYFIRKLLRLAVIAVVVAAAVAMVGYGLVRLLARCR